MSFVEYLYELAK